MGRYLDLIRKGKTAKEIDAMLANTRFAQSMDDGQKLMDTLIQESHKMLDQWVQDRNYPLYGMYK